MGHVHSYDCYCSNCESKNSSHYEKDFSKTVQWNSLPISSNPAMFWKDYWSAKTWTTWHSKVKEKYGKDRANEVFIEHFRNAPIVSFTTDFRTYDKDFIAYAKKNGFYDALFSGIFGVAGKAAGTLNKTVEATGEVISSAGDIIGFTGKYFKWILAGILIFVVLYFVVQLRK